MCCTKATWNRTSMALTTAMSSRSGHISEHGSIRSIGEPLADVTYFLPIALPMIHVRTLITKLSACLEWCAAAWKSLPSMDIPLRRYF